MSKKITTSNAALPANQNPLERIENLILNIRGKQVMLDRDLARLYGVETKRLNEVIASLLLYRLYHFQMYRVYQNQMYHPYHFEMYRL